MAVTFLPITPPNPKMVLHVVLRMQKEQRIYFKAWRALKTYIRLKKLSKFW